MFYKTVKKILFPANKLVCRYCGVFLPKVDTRIRSRIQTKLVFEKCCDPLPLHPWNASAPRFVVPGGGPGRWRLFAPTRPCAGMLECRDKLNRNLLQILAQLGCFICIVNTNGFCNFKKPF
jgi:hypothetical protein